MVCPRCGCKKSYSKYTDYINYELCEYDITCSFCHYEYEYFAYGATQSHYDREGRVLCWNNIKINIKFFFQKIYYTLKRRIKGKLGENDNIPRNT